METHLLAFRPAVTAQRLTQASQACPLNSRDIIAATAARRGALPVIVAPIPAVVRAALLAAKEANSVVGLALPASAPPHPWFASVAEAADELAPCLPIFLCGEVVVRGDTEQLVEAAASEAYKLVDAGVTHLAVDASAAAPNTRARATVSVAQAATERELGLECILPPYGGIPAASRAAALLDALKGQGLAADVASVRCPAPQDGDDADAQLGRLTEIATGLRGIPLLRRGPISRPLLDRLQKAQLRLCEDGASAFLAALRAVPDSLKPALEQSGDSFQIEVASILRNAGLSEEITDKMEALAYLEVCDLIAAVGSKGSALDVASHLAEKA